jgi:hypothetical protein
MRRHRGTWTIPGEVKIGRGGASRADKQDLSSLCIQLRYLSDLNSRDRLTAAAAAAACDPLEMILSGHPHPIPPTKPVVRSIRLVLRLVKADTDGRDEREVHAGRDGDEVLRGSARTTRVVQPRQEDL